MNNNNQPKVYSPLGIQPASGYATDGTAVVSQTTITRTINSAPQKERHSKLPFEILNIIAATGILLGAILILAGAAIGARGNRGYYNGTSNSTEQVFQSYFSVDQQQQQDPQTNAYEEDYRTVGILFIIGFSIWFIVALIAIVAAIIAIATAFRDHSNDGKAHNTLHILENILFLLAAACLVVGAALWLSNDGNARHAGEVIWIIGASLLLLAWFLRALAAYTESSFLYKERPVNDENWHPSANILSSITANALSSLLYLIAAVLLLLGAICFLIRGNKGGYTTDAGYTFAHMAYVLWIVAASIIIISSIAHCLSRR